MSENTEKKEMQELNLQSILENIDEINNNDEMKEIEIEHKRLNSTFKFLVPQLADLSKIGGKDSSMNISEVYNALSLNLLTKIDDKMLEALKVAKQVDAIKKLFTEDEILMVMASLMENVSDDGIAIKKQ